MGSPKAAKMPRMADKKKGLFLKICSPKAAKLPRMGDSKKMYIFENGFSQGSEAAQDG